MLSFLLMTAMAAAQPDPDWHERLDWNGRQAQMDVEGSGYLLRNSGGERSIPMGSFRTDTASPLFDGLFAMAQDDLHKNSVAAISDASFDHNQPIPCACFETGDKWHYVWTRDLSYAVDLGLWRFDPARVDVSLRFKLSDVREPSAQAGLYVMQDTGSGGSWPISTDRVVWFLAARHQMGSHDFDNDLRRALQDTLAQDRKYAFDNDMGLYRGETSFLDWREQTYPAWTANNVRFIAQSFALSTNVLHYLALQQAGLLAAVRHDDGAAAHFIQQADDLKQAINAHFWRPDRKLYMSYIGGDGQPIEAYDLLGLSLAITSGVAYTDYARQALANYPSWPAGSPVIWPERADQAIYHNRAIWPFVSAYALRAARVVNDPVRIEHELRSLMRGAALAGSNMENFELTTQAVHVEDGKLSGPVVNSQRQLWSIAGYLDMVIEGVFGLEGDRIEPKLPVSLVPMLFGQRSSIGLQLPDRNITLRLPAKLDGNLLVADRITRSGKQIDVQLKAIAADALPLRTDALLYAPPTPDAPTLEARGSNWQLRSSGKGVLYLNGKKFGAIDGTLDIARTSTQQCFAITRVGDDGIESLPSPSVCKGDDAVLRGAWPRQWKAPSSGRFQVMLTYSNNHGPISSGVTAAVKRLQVRCGNGDMQEIPIVLPHSVGEQHSTTGLFNASAGDSCRFTLAQGFNMSYLTHFAHFTGGQGGIDGPVNEAAIGALSLVPVTTKSAQP